MITYSRVTKDDLKDIIEYYETYLNSGEAVRSSIRSAFEQGRYFGYKAMDQDTDKVAGYFTFQEGVLLTYPHADYERELEHATAHRRTVTVDALMVDRGYRARGIAKELARLNLEDLRSRGVELFCVEIWVYPDGSIPAKNVYEAMGKPIYHKLAADFYKDAHTFGISCPICGTHCKCGALLEVIRI
ncbi:MAG: GNAT family N-acetyltransferase [Lachnospiraceae bacterium]|nr:GNAT family N-acetyltransferase [Lachnospiraceae bacterium]